MESFLKRRRKREVSYLFALEIQKGRECSSSPATASLSHNPSHHITSPFSSVSYFLFPHEIEIEKGKGKKERESKEEKEKHKKKKKEKKNEKEQETDRKRRRERKKKEKK